MSALAAGQVPGLAPIGLAELVGEAELLTRVDRKYVVPAEDAWRLLAEVPEGTRVLQIDGRREFGYRSTYLDTPDRLSYLTSGRSQRGRWKVRTRSYLDTGGSWLEVKTRGPRGSTVKRRIPHPDTARLTAEGARFVGGIVGGDITAALQPVLVSSYRRTTLYLPWSRSRVTVDVDLRWTSLEDGAELVIPARAMVETKTGATPSEVDRLLWSRGHRPLRISKYGAGMAALHPELPRLKWHRALDRHLALDPLTRSHEGALS